MALKSHLLDLRIGLMVKSILALPEDPGLISNTHMIVHTISSASETLLISAGSRHVCDIYTYMDAKHSYTC